MPDPDHTADPSPDAATPAAEAAETERPPTVATTETPASSVHPDILAMEDALDRGDHVRTRELATTLAASDDVKLKATGEAMLARLRPDPVIVAVMLSTGMLMLALALGYLGPR